jgi:hypothetical protein
VKVDNQKLTDDNTGLWSKIRCMEDNENVLRSQIDNLLSFIDELEGNNKDLMKFID